MVLRQIALEMRRPQCHSAAMAHFSYPPVNAALRSGGYYLTTAGREKSAGAAAYPLSGHPPKFDFDWQRGRKLHCFAVVMIVDGTGEWESPRGLHLPVAAGDVLFLVPGGWHRYRPHAATGWTEVWGGVGGTMVLGMVAAGHLPATCQLLAGAGSLSIRAGLEHLVSDVVSLPDENRASWAMRALAVMLEVSGEASRPGPLPSKPHTTVTRALQFIEENLHRPIAVPEVASFAGVSRRTLERDFSEADIGAVSHHIIAQRVARAERMLLETKLSAKEIAFDCGFGGSQRMIYDFHRLRGLTPIQVRRGVS